MDKFGMTDNKHSDNYTRTIQLDVESERHDENDIMQIMRLRCHANRPNGRITWPKRNKAVAIRPTKQVTNK